MKLEKFPVISNIGERYLAIVKISKELGLVRVILKVPHKIFNREVFWFSTVYKNDMLYDFTYKYYSVNPVKYIKEAIDEYEERDKELFFKKIEFQNNLIEFKEWDGKCE